VTDTGPQEERLESPGEIAQATSSVPKRPFSTSRQLAAARDLLRTLAVAQNTSSLYPTTHPQVIESVQGLVSSVAAMADLEFTEVTVNIYKNTIFVENQVFPEESVTYRKLVELLLTRGISALTMADAITAEEATALISLLGNDDIRDIAASQDYLAQHGVKRAQVAETTTLDESDKRKVVSREVKTTTKKIYDNGRELIQDIETQAKLGKVFDVSPLQNMVSDVLDNLLKDPAAVLGLTAIKDHDNYTLNHSINVCILSLALGASLDMDKDSLKSLGLSALLYDLGKVRIPEDILNKKEPLDSDEWEIIKSHTQEGADLLKRIQLVDQMPMVVAFEHHMRHDRAGYPDTQSQEQHLFSKIIALCDAYDAMTTRRPFRHEIRPDKAIAVLMQGRGKAYDPSITKALVAMLGIYPMGAVTRLEDDSYAVVYRVNSDDLLRPRVKILISPEGQRHKEPETVDLRVIDPETGDYVLSITEVVPASEAGIDDVWEYL